ncbi:hypothetical protein FisN_8Lh094 [Fistulifera solaris]|uniref:amino-acid N-acetyltransferase n=1 Tax=Fistulifera solaris TaxID=1519565 RepID=A0A1Z5JDA8_FISSO|nr:hypothetical protein FisN_8Lh094 [Fistulifera solaris]|eukprot:GAX12000.1 hypothetical protein FisN_8Lh094 [Fistulifera solaris]
MFRGSANYIANHRNTLAVYHIPGGLLDLEDPAIFRNLMNDIALTWLLGMKVVLVVGCRHQIEKRLNEKHRLAGVRVTDKDTLRVVKEEAGYVRFEVERELARALRLQSSGMDGNVVSGNFYSAQPLGILDGIDYEYTGFVRKVEVDKIKRLHDNRDICLLTTLGVSPSGEVFNVCSESLAATVAGAMKASKVIFFTEKETELRSTVHGKKIQSLRFSDAKALLDYSGLAINKKGFSTISDRMAGRDPSTVDMLHKIGWSVEAVENGNVLEKDIEMYYVYTRDNLIVACGQLKQFEKGYAEIGCLVVNSEYRKGGRGDAMLGYLERMCVMHGCTSIFVLSTQTMEWFLERGFEEVGVEELPPSRQATYNHVRKSKIYLKRIESVRDLDANELWWNR